MARAKRTNRAEARRRYRASLAEDRDDFDDEASDEQPAAPEEVTSGRRPERRSTPAPAPAARPGIGAAFRASFRPLDLRGDLRALPSLIRHKSVWLPVMLTVASAIFYAAVTPPIPAEQINADRPVEQTIAGLLFQYFVWSPPVASIFLAGFLAPRASYLTGGIAGTVGALAFIPIVASRVGLFVQLDEVGINQYIASSLVASPLAGILFGGAAGWYRRFLMLANPNRARAAAARANEKQSRRRGSQGRPMLARRR